MITLLFMATLATTADPMAPINAQLHRGDTRLALYDLEDILKWDPENLDGLWVKARILTSYGELNEANATYATILKYDEWDDEARKQRIQILWRLGKSTEALDLAKLLLKRHPDDLDTQSAIKDLELNKKAKRASSWSPIIRGSVGTFYDSNVIFASGGDLTISDTQAGVLVATAEAGAQHATRRQAFSMAARATTRVAMGGAKDAMTALASNAGATLIYTRDVKRLRLGIDARYDEWFTNVFAESRQRTASPSFTLGIPINDRHRLQALIGSDIAHVTAIQGFTDNASIKGMIRDDMVFRGLWLTLDIGGLMDIVYGKQRDAVPLLGNYGEAWAAATASYRLFWKLDALGAISGSVRRYTSGNHEEAYRLLAGLRTILKSNIELQLEYSFGQRFADVPRGYQRHEVGLTVRFWYN